MSFQFDFGFFLYELGVACRYIPIVLLLAVVPLGIGLLMGTGIAVVRLLRVHPVDQFFTVGVVFLRGVPLVLQLIILYLAFSLGFDSLALHFGWNVGAKDVSYTFIALVGLTVNASVYLSEVMRTALRSVKPGQYEAAYSIGLTTCQTLRRIVIPQALPVAVPLIGSQFINLIKGSSVASLISVVEIINATVYEANGNYKFLEAYMAAALVYWGLCMVVERLTSLAENRIGVYHRGGVL